MIAGDPDNAMTPSGTLLFRIQDDIEDASAFKIGKLNTLMNYKFRVFLNKNVIWVFLDPMSGLITTLKPLDREQKASYKIIIEVSDHGQPPQAATRVLRINVLDIDDHRPRFVRDVVSELTFLFILFLSFDYYKIQLDIL